VVENRKTANRVLKERIANIRILPTELAQIGFEDGVHFVGFAKKRKSRLSGENIFEESARHRIAEVARDKVLCEHSYDGTVETILELAKQNGRRFLAPSRSWSEERVHRGTTERQDAS